MQQDNQSVKCKCPVCKKRDVFKGNFICNYCWETLPQATKRRES